MAKRTRTDGHLSKEQYNARVTASSLQIEPTGRLDADTQVARQLTSSGLAKMRLLNKTFKSAVDGVLAEEEDADLTGMISDYFTYSARVKRTYLATAGQVHMCGNGDCGQLGFGTEELRDMEIKTPRLLPMISQEKVVSLACGAVATAALTKFGKVYTWGSSDDGGLGRPGGSTAPEQFPHQVVDGLEGTTIIGLAAGDCQTLALDLSGKVYGWGCYKDKEGKPWFQPPPFASAKSCKGAAKRPVPITGLPDCVVEVQCGASFCLALTKKQEVFSWGIGEIGELGREVCPMKHPPVPGSEEEPGYDFEGILRDHLTPGGMYKEPVAGEVVGARMENVKAIGCGEYHSLVISAGDSDVFACGLNSYGQLGLGDKTNRMRLALIDTFLGRYATAATGGAQHSLVLTADGLFSFGRNDSGQLGCSERISKSDWGLSIETPQEVFLPPDAGRPLQVECGTNHCLVITDKHELYTWGYGDSGALANGSDADCTLPKKVDLTRFNVSKVFDVSGGGHHTALVCETDETKEWW